MSVPARFILCTLAVCLSHCVSEEVTKHLPQHHLMELICRVANECIEKNLHNKLCHQEHNKKKRSTWRAAMSCWHSVPLYIVILCEHVSTALLFLADQCISMILCSVLCHVSTAEKVVLCEERSNKLCDYYMFVWILCYNSWIRVSTEPHAVPPAVCHLHIQLYLTLSV